MDRGRKRYPREVGVRKLGRRRGEGELTTIIFKITFTIAIILIIIIIIIIDTVSSYYFVLLSLSLLLLSSSQFPERIQKAEPPNNPLVSPCDIGATFGG